MLPDYPRLKERATKLLMNHLKNMRLRHSSILPQISNAVQHEGEALAYKDVDGKETQTQFRKFEADVELSREHMKQGRFEETLEAFGGMARSFAEQQEKHLIDAVSRAAEASGNVTAAVGPLTKEHLLESLRKVQWGFDPATGEARRPDLILSPEGLEKYKSRFEEWHRDPEFLAQVDAIEQQQRKDWHDRESRRRVVD